MNLNSLTLPSYIWERVPLCGVGCGFRPPSWRVAVASVWVRQSLSQRVPGQLDVPGPRSQGANIILFCLLFYVLATSKIITGWAPTCGSVHSWWLYSAAPLGNQVTSTMTWYLTQSYYPDTKPTSPFHILIMSSALLGSNKYQFLGHWFDLTTVRTHEVQVPDFPKRETGVLLIRPSRLVANII